MRFVQKFALLLTVLFVAVFFWHGMPRVATWKTDVRFVKVNLESNRNYQSVQTNSLPEQREPDPSNEPSSKIKARIAESYGKTPLIFEANTGQTNKKVKFLSRGQGYGLYLAPTEAVMVLNKKTETLKDAQDSPAVLRMRLAGANSHPRLTGEEAQSSKSNYFIGNDPKKWRKNIANYGKVRYESVYEGIDLVYYGNQGKLEYDFIVQPGADYKKIRLQFKGADRVSIDGDGNLVLHTKHGDVVQHKPVVYQIDACPFANGAKGICASYANRKDVKKIFGQDEQGLQNKSRVVADELTSSDINIFSPIAGRDREGGTGVNDYSPVQGRYTLLADNQVGFEVENYDRGKSLVIDPTLLFFFTYLGGSGGDYGRSIAVDSSGNAYVTGYTNSSNFPTSGAYQTSNGGGYDAFVTKLDSTGTTLSYSTYLGGSGSDAGYSIAVDSSGNAYVSGYTDSSNFPTSGAYQSSNGGGVDAFVAKLSSSGAALTYSTYLGGSGTDYSQGIAVDSSGNAYITGITNSSNFPTSGAYQSSNAGSNDVFIAKLGSSGATLSYSTYLGGTGSDAGYAIAVDSSGNAYITGITNSSSFPTSGAYQSSNAGGNDAFVAKLGSAGATLSYSTYLGGSGSDTGYAIAVDTSGNAYITGVTDSSTFPTSGPYQSAKAGSNDVFVTKLGATGATLSYSTYLGGAGSDAGYAIVVDIAGNAYIVGATASSNFPVTSAYQGSNGGSNDAFVASLDSSGVRLLYSTYLGGTGSEEAFGIAMDSSRNAYITGNVSSSGLSTTGAYQTTMSTGPDSFVTKVMFTVSDRVARNVSVFSPYWQSGPDSYTFIGISHPSLSGMASAIGVYVIARNLSGGIANTSSFTVSTELTQKLFIVATNASTYSGLNSTQLPSANFMVNASGYTGGDLIFTPIASSPAVSSSSGGNSDGFRDITMLAMWGVIVAASTSTGFAMEFIGDLTDSRNPSSSLPVSAGVN